MELGSLEVGRSWRWLGQGEDRRIEPLRLLLDRFKLHPREASFAVRGFHQRSPALTRRLEDIGETFIAGYNLGLLARAAEPLLAEVNGFEPGRRGFAAEGAAMGCAIADALTLGGRRFPAWLDAAGGDFTHLIHVGAGWALARTPWRLRAVMRTLDPVHRWLAFDGMGFHDAYFHWDSIRAGWRRVMSGYAPRAYDQGVGRALWFVGGGDAAWIADEIDRFGPARQADVWSGLGLAVTYAGGAGDPDLAALPARAGRFAPDLAQGSAFGAAAHAHAGHVPGHARRGVAALTGLDCAEAVQRVAEARAEAERPPAAETPAYELWRRGVRAALAHDAAGAGR